MNAHHIDAQPAGPASVSSPINLIDRFEKGVRTLADQIADDAVLREELRLAAAHLRNARIHRELWEYERMEEEERARALESERES